MKSYQLLNLLILIIIFSCSKEEKIQLNQEELNFKIKELKQQDLAEIEEGRKLKKIDSLSKYKISEMSRFVDSLKVSDSVKYFALKKVIENDTVNFYDDYVLISLWNVTKLKSDSEYKESAKKILLEKNK